MTTPDNDNILPNPVIQDDAELSEPELFEHHRIVVDKGQAMLRIDKYLQMRLEGISRTKIQAAAKAGCIMVNDRPVKSNYKTKPCDTISILLPEPPHETELLPEPVPFHITYEDDDVLVVDKQPGLVVHPGYGNFTGTLLNGLLYYFQGKQGRDGQPVVPYLVHRIDKDTSGLLLIAKNEEAQAILAKQFFDHTTERKARRRIVASCTSLTTPNAANTPSPTGAWWNVSAMSHWWSAYLKLDAHTKSALTCAI